MRNFTLYLYFLGKIFFTMDYWLGSSMRPSEKKKLLFCAAGGPYRLTLCQVFPFQRDPDLGAIERRRGRPMGSLGFPRCGGCSPRHLGPAVVGPGGRQFCRSRRQFCRSDAGSALTALGGGE